MNNRWRRIRKELEPTTTEGEKKKQESKETRKELSPSSYRSFPSVFSPPPSIMSTCICLSISWHCLYVWVSVCVYLSACLILSQSCPKCLMQPIFSGQSPYQSCLKSASCQGLFSLSGAEIFTSLPRLNSYRQNAHRGYTLPTYSSYNSFSSFSCSFSYFSFSFCFFFPSFFYRLQVTSSRMPNQMLDRPS